MNFNELKLEQFQASVDIPDMGVLKVGWDGEQLWINGVATQEQLVMLLNRLKVSAAATPQPLVTRVLPHPPKNGAPKGTKAALAAPGATINPGVAPSPSPSANAALEASEEDLAVFASMDTLKAVVQELKQRGASTYITILAAAKDVQDSGGCPLLTRIGDKLADRLVATCATLDIPGDALNNAS